VLDDKLMDPRELRNAFGCFASGITIVSLRDKVGKPTGVTVSSFSSLSLDPALCLFSLGKTQPSCQLLEHSDAFNINILSECQEDIAWQFSRPSQDKFSGISWRPGMNTMPIIDNCLCHFECKKWATYDGGDHLIIVGEIMNYDKTDGAPLLFYKGQIAEVAQ